MLFKRPKFNYDEYSSYNLETLEFINFHNLTQADISKITEKILEPQDVDSILEEKSITTEPESTSISIDDILGYNYPRKRDLFESMSEFFDSTRDGYQSRSIDMLKYTTDNIMSGLARSFIVEPIKVKEINPGECFIDGNGMHRFTILRIMYLIEKSRGKNLDELKRKYTIPVILSKVDKVKTYCAFIIKLIDSDIFVTSEIDENYKKTNRVRIDVSNGKRYLTDEELIVYTNELVSSKKLDIEFLIRISKHVAKNKSFNNFLKNHFSSLLDEIESFLSYKNRCQTTWEIYEYQPQKEVENKWNL